MVTRRQRRNRLLAGASRAGTRPWLTRVRLLVRWAVREAGLARLEAYVIPDNIASQRVLTKAGFRREQLLRSSLAYEGRRFDALLYSLLPSDLA